MEDIDNLQHNRQFFPNLNEYIPMKFISKIPAEAQRMLTHIKIKFTCVDVEEEYVAVGSNVGILYLYDRKKDKLFKLRNKDYKNSITCVKLLKSLECLVAFGCEKGSIFVFKVPFDDLGQMEQFVIEDIHSSPITALEWIKNGIHLYSGDETGLVVSTMIDHLKHESRSQILVRQKSKIVQLSYFNRCLCISDLHQSVIFGFNDNKCIRIGQKDRKWLGSYGATFCDSGNIFASRPTQRLWKSDVTGTVKETILLKNALSLAFKLSQDQTDTGVVLNFEIGPLNVFDSKFLISWSSSSIVLIDPDRTVVKRVYNSNSILDVAVCKNEIFVLQGIRHLVRLCAASDGTEIIEEEAAPNIFKDFISPFKDLTLSAKKSMAKKEEQKDEGPDVFDWLKRKFSESNFGDMLEDKFKNMNSDANEATEMSAISKPVFNIEPADELPSFLTDMGTDFFEEEIVFKPKKRKDKKGSSKPIASPSLSSVNSDGQESQVVEIPESADQHEIQDDNSSKEANVNSDTTDSILDSTNLSTSQSYLSEILENDTVSTKDENNSFETQNILTDNESTAQYVKNEISEDNKNCAIEPNAERTPEVSLELDITTSDDPLSSPDDIYAGFEFKMSGSNYERNSELNNNKNELSDSLSASTSSVETEVQESHLPKQGVDFVQYEAPGSVISLTASNNHVFCIDSNHCVYMSEFPTLGFNWKILDQLGDQIEVSPSGQIAWILYKHTVYASLQKSQKLWEDVQWIPFAADVINIAVGDVYGWYIKTGGRVIYNKDITAAQPYTYPKTFVAPSNVVQIASSPDDVVIMLTSDDKLYCTSSVSSNERKQIKLDGVKDICKFCFGINQSVYVINAEGMLCFRIGITPMVPVGIEGTWMVESSGIMYEAPKVERGTNFWKFGQSQNQKGLLASSIAGVWFCQKFSSIIHTNQKSISGHFWDSVVPLGTVSTMKWKLLCAQGIIHSQAVFWALNNADEMFCFTNNFTNSVVINPPSSANLRQLVTCADSVWFLSTAGKIFVRQEISRKCPQGVWWQSLDINQLGDVTLAHISCSKQVVWACDVEGFVYLRLGSLNTIPGTTQSQAWIEVESDLPPLQVKKIYVGPDHHHIVWAIDNSNNAYCRDGLLLELFIGLIWVFVPAPQAQQLCITNDTVWLLSTSGEIYRRFGVSKKCPMGDYWKQIPMNLSQLSVTVDNELWGIHNESIYSHTCYNIEYQKKTIEPLKVTEDDWEDLADYSDKG